MAPSSKGPSRPQPAAAPTWTVVATTVPPGPINQLNSSPDFAADTATAYSPVQNGSSYTCCGLTASGVWAATGPQSGTGNSNTGCVMPSGRYWVTAGVQNNSPWTSGHFDVHFKKGALKKVKLPGKGHNDLTNLTVSGNLVTGSGTIFGQPAQVSLTANGSTLFGLVVYTPQGGSDGGQTVGVFGAEAGGGDPEEPPQK